MQIQQGTNAASLLDCVWWRTIFMLMPVWRLEMWIMIINLGDWSAVNLHWIDLSKSEHFHCYATSPRTTHISPLKVATKFYGTHWKGAFFLLSVPIRAIHYTLKRICQETIILPPPSIALGCTWFKEYCYPNCPSNKPPNLRTRMWNH